MRASRLTARWVPAALFRLQERLEQSNKFLWLVVFVPIATLYLATLRRDGATLITDATSVTSSAWQLGHHGTPRIPAGAHIWDAWIIPSGTGHVISNREPGLIGLAAPFYCAFHSASILNVAPASVAAALVTAAAVATLAVLLREFISARAALLAGLIVGTATTTWAVSGTALFPHGPDQLYLALAMLAVARGRFALSGVAFALAILTRPPLAVAAAVIGAWIAWERRSVRPALAIAVPSVLGLVGVLLYSHKYWGGGLQSQYTATGMGGDYRGRFTSIGPHAWADFLGNILGTLISPGRGIVFGSPFLVVLAFGLRQAWRVAPAWVRSSAGAGVVYLAVLFKSSRFQGGAPFWGYRYPIETMTLLVPLLALAWREYVTRTARRRATFGGLVVVSAAMQAIGAIAFPGADQNGTVVWTFSDLRAAVSNHPLVASVILIAGYLAAAVTFWRIDAKRGRTSTAPAG